MVFHFHLYRLLPLLEWVQHLDYRPTYSAKNLHELSQRMHVRRVLFGHVLYVREARPLGLSLRHLLEVLLVLRRLHLHPLEGRGREMEGETEGEREREGDRWVRVPVTVRVSG